MVLRPLTNGSRDFALPSVEDMTPPAQQLHVAVVGTGYVGLVTAAGLADLGFRVSAIDIDADKVARLRGGDPVIHEPGLDELLARGLESGLLTVGTSLAEVLPTVAAVLVAVATPSQPDGAADLFSVNAVVDLIAAHVHAPLVVVMKSTVPVGTCLELEERINARIQGRGLAFRISMASNPEFLRESQAILDFAEPERIVIGVEDDAAERLLRVLYAPLSRRGVPVLAMDFASAELTKYAANAMLATRISFMNQLTALCDEVGADVNQVRDGVGTDSRIGSAFLSAGLGFGGSCFPKDLRALRHLAGTHGVAMPLLDATLEVNRRQHGLPVRELAKQLELRGSRVAVWGLAFKPGTDDVRESPALAVFDDLLAAGATVVVHDPAALGNLPPAWRDRVRTSRTPLGAARGADALVLVTEWSEYGDIHPGSLAAAMRGRLVVDGRNALDAAALEQHGFAVVGVGRGASVRARSDAVAAEPHLAVMR